MGTPILSKQMSIVFDGSTLGCTTDFSLSVDKDLIEINCLDSTAKGVMPDLYGWNISFSGLVLKTSTVTAGNASFEDLVTNIKSDSSVGIHILPDISSNVYYTGTGYLSSVTMDGGVGSAVSFSGEVAGHGALTTTTTS